MSTPPPASPQGSAPNSPRSQAGSVRAATGPRVSGSAPAEVRRPLVGGASYVPSDVAPPSYGLPSAEYIRRYKTAQLEDVEHGRKRAAKQPAVQEPRPPKRPSKKRLINATIAIVLCVLGGLAVAALMSMASLAAWQCGARAGDGVSVASVVDTPCVAIETNNLNGECAAPGVFTRYANRTGGECCMPAGYICSTERLTSAPCADEGTRVLSYVGAMASERMCCHAEGLRTATPALRTLPAALVALRDEMAALRTGGFRKDDVDTVHAQLLALGAALEGANHELGPTIQALGETIAAAEQAIMRREAADAAVAARARQEAEDAANKLVEAEAAAKAAAEAEAAAAAAAAAKAAADAQAAAQAAAADQAATETAA